jgi:hypothetical protein
VSAARNIVPAVTGNDRYSLPPVRRGRIFCSPWCGHDCTWAAHEQAHRRAAALAGSLGPNWTPRVWENLGWHFCARHATQPIEIHASGDGFICYANLSPQFLGEGRTAPAALDDALRKARDLVAGLRASLVELGALQR